MAFAQSGSSDASLPDQDLAFAQPGGSGGSLPDQDAFVQPGKHELYLTKDNFLISCTTRNFHTAVKKEAHFGLLLITA